MLSDDICLTNANAGMGKRDNEIPTLPPPHEFKCLEANKFHATIWSYCHQQASEVIFLWLENVAFLLCACVCGAVEWLPFQ